MRLVSDLETLLEGIVSKRLARGATTGDLAVGRQAIRLLLTICDWVEREIPSKLRREAAAVIPRLRQRCLRYEFLLWQTAAEFRRQR